MTTASPRADTYVMSYDLGKADGDYTAVTIFKELDDGSLEVVAILTEEREVSRRELLDISVEQIRLRKPKTWKVRIGTGEPIPISDKTVEAILDGRITAKDLLIGS